MESRDGSGPSIEGVDDSGVTDELLSLDDHAFSVDNNIIAAGVWALELYEALHFKTIS